MIGGARKKYERTIKMLSAPLSLSRQNTGNGISSKSLFSLSLLSLFDKF